MIHHGDCIEVMATLPADSVDAVVTDPPYGLEFMGKEWDSAHKLWGTFEGEWKDRPKGGTHPFANPRPVYRAGTAFQAWCEAWGREALRVTKPGGYLLAFGGTRTHHRLVCGLEDAGWIIRDELDWIYASGFPKGKANLKPAHEPIVLARKPGPLRPLGIDECRISTQGETISVPQSDPRKRSGTVGADLGITKASVEAFQAAQRESGERTATLGRWPSNVLLSDPELFDEPNPEVVGSGAVMGPSAPASGPTWEGPSGSPSRSPFRGTDREPQFYGDSGGYSRFFIVPKADRSDREPVLGGLTSDAGHVAGTPTNSVKRCRNCGSSRLGEGGAHICKPGCQEKIIDLVPSQVRRRSNTHPTVKPTDLMRHLIRLVTPAGGVVLDPFLGSGTTAIAAELEGFEWIGIEKEAEYIAIAEARLNGTQRGLGLSEPAIRRGGGPVDLPAPVAGSTEGAA